MPSVRVSRAGAVRVFFRVRRCVMVLVAVAVLAGCTSAPRGPVVEIATERGETVRVPVELARTREELSRGLMWRDDLPSDAGMLFVFDHDAERTFWMKNTPLPLDIVFIDRDGKVLNVAAGTKPFSTAPIRSAGKARYVLEVHAGFAQRQGIDAGDVVGLPDLAATAESR